MASDVVSAFVGSAFGSSVEVILVNLLSIIGSCWLSSKYEINFRFRAADSHIEWEGQIS